MIINIIVSFQSTRGARGANVLIIISHPLVQVPYVIIKNLAPGWSEVAPNSSANRVCEVGHEF